MPLVHNIAKHTHRHTRCAMLYGYIGKHTGTKKPALGGLFCIIQTYVEASEFR